MIHSTSGFVISGYFDNSKLAVQLIDMRASTPQIKMERTMSQIARGEVLALNYLAANGNRAYPKDMSKALMLTSARVVRSSYKEQVNGYF